MQKHPDSPSLSRHGRPVGQCTSRSSAALASALVLALSTLGTTAQAQDRHEHGPRGQRGGPPGVFFDQRHHHDHFYPSRGYVVGALPVGAMAVSFGGLPYHFHGGVWFSPRGGRFVVVLPPVGIVVPLLPPAYVALWIGGGRYFYANGVYYAPAPGGYVVVAPPPRVDDAVTGAPPAGVAAPAVPASPAQAAPKPPPEPVIYPRNGQSSTQTEADRQECNRWATTVPAALADAEVFQRAIAACMDGRGYTVR